MCVRLTTEASNCRRQKLIQLRGGIDGCVISAGDSNAPHSAADRSSRQEISENRVELNNTINQLHVIDISRLLHPIAGEITFFLRSCGTFIEIDPIRGQKTHFKKFKRTEIIYCLLSDRNGIKLEINNEKTAENSPTTRRLNNRLLNNLPIKEKKFRGNYIYIYSIGWK